MIKNKQKKKLFNGVESYKFALYPLVLAVTVLISILSVDFDWSVITTPKFLFKVAMKVLILFAWVYFGIPDGKKFGERKEDYIDKKKMLVRTVQLIKDKGIMFPLREYVKEYNQKTRKETAENILFTNSIDPILLDKPIREIKKHYEEWDLDKAQMNILIAIKRGRFYWTETNFETYISVFESVNDQEQATVHEGRIIFKELLPKIVALIFMTVITSSAIIGEKMGVGSALFEAGSNLALCLTSYGFAIRTGLKITDRYTVAFTVRDNFIHGFIEAWEKGKFVPELAMYQTIEEEEKPIEEHKQEAKSEVS